MVSKASSDAVPAASSAASVESHVGALVELRFIGSPSMDQVVEYEAKLGALVRRMVKEGRTPVLCTDLRSCQVLAPEVSDRIVELMKNDNPHIARNAFLGQSSALVTLQARRFIAETGGVGRRRIFAEEGALVAWLSEVTTVPEQMRLRAFLKA